MSKIRVGIIGGGSSGATACKACLEEGFDVVVYEKTDQTGGLWRYREDVIEGVGSVFKSTIINASKEITAFSDFPFPSHYPNYMDHKKIASYLDSYGKTFNFEKYVRFEQEVIKVEPNPDYDETGKWIITVEDLKTGQKSDEVFDGVMICSGYYTKPSIPVFKSQHIFRGDILHTHSYRTPELYSDKRVVIVGIGFSGCDAAVELSSTAEQVYISSARGNWIGSRLGFYGKPTDYWIIRRIVHYLLAFLSYSTVCSIFESYLNFQFNHSEYGIKPKKRRVISHKTVLNDTLPVRILSGTVVIKPNIERFTENGVIFEGETEETPTDVVLLATGYKLSFPFISKSIINADNNDLKLYKHVFAPHLKHPHTLSVISIVSPFGPQFPVSELQSRWFAQLMARKQTLPEFKTMIEDIESNHLMVQSLGERHPNEVDWIDYLDELGQQFGTNPNLRKYFFSDNKLWRALVFGLSVPYQYRLEGPHSWSGARDAILTADDRVSAPLKTRGQTPEEGREGSQYTYKRAVILMAVVVIILYIFFN